MTKFSECFREIIEKRGLNCSQMATILGIGKSVVNNWYNGIYIPEKWSSVEKIALNLNLYEDERRQLFELYEKERLGKKYDAFKGIEDIIFTINDNLLTYNNVEKEKENSDIKKGSLPDFSNLNTHMEVMRFAKKLLYNIAQSETRDIMLYLNCVTSKVWSFIKLFCSQIEHFNIKIIICADYNKSEKDLDIIRQLVEMMVKENIVQLWFDLEGSSLTGVVNYIITENSLFRFSVDLQHAMFTENKEWLQYYRESFEDVIKIIDPFKWETDNEINAILDVELCTKDILYTLEDAPCLTLGLSKDILEKCIYEYIPNREGFIEQILTRCTYFTADAGNKKNFINCFFRKEGLTEFMETGIVSGFDPSLYRPLTMSMRCEMLARCIELWEEDFITYNCIREDSDVVLNRGYIELTLSERNIVCIKDWHKGKHNEQIEINNNDVCRKFFDFFNYIEDSIYVYSKEETLEYMRKVLLKYKSNITLQIDASMWRKFYNEYK